MSREPDSQVAIAEPADKAAWRNAMRHRRRQLAAAERRSAGQAVAALLVAWSHLPRSGTVGSFIALPEEFPTAALHRQLQATGLRLAVPAFDREAACYRFTAWQPGESLMLGPMRVPEPRQKCWLDESAIDLFLVPGLAFDRRGGRIGYGGGHYDRLLARRHGGVAAVALGYVWQLVGHLPQSGHDIPIDWVLSPAGFTFVGKKPLPADSSTTVRSY